VAEVRARTAAHTLGLGLPPRDRGPDRVVGQRQLLVETWISHGPRTDDTVFDPRVGDWVDVGDDEEPPCPARVTRRDGNRVWVQLDLGLVATDASGQASEHR